MNDERFWKLSLNLAKMTTNPYMKPVNLSTNPSKDLEDTLFFLENWIEFVEEWNSEEQEG